MILEAGITAINKRGQKSLSLSSCPFSGSFQKVKINQVTVFGVLDDSKCSGWESRAYWGGSEGEGEGRLPGVTSEQGLKAFQAGTIASAKALRQPGSQCSLSGLRQKVASNRVRGDGARRCQAWEVL